MIFNRFYYCFTILATTIILSSCLGSNSDNIDYEILRDAQILSVEMSSSEDSLKVLSKVAFSIDQVSSVPLIFNKDSLPYLFDVSKVSLRVNTKGSSGIKLHLFNPDSSYIWNQNDSVEIKKLQHIEVFAQDGVTTKKYTFKLNTHQQDPDTIFWQSVVENYIPQPEDQVAVLTETQFFNYYKLNSSIKLSTSSVDDGVAWTDQQVVGLPYDILLKSIQSDVFEENRIWYAMDKTNNVYESANGKDWSMRPTGYTIKTILGRLPSFTKDSILTIVEDEGVNKFAKTKDFSSFNLLNNIPIGFPINDYTSTVVSETFNYTAKYLIVTGGVRNDETPNQNVWLLQENDAEIRSTSVLPPFNVTGSSLFNYDKKIYLMTSVNNKNVFYTSSNYGGFWKIVSDKQSLPSDFKYRTDQSVTVDDKDNIWIFGGHTNLNSQIVDIWKGRINKLFIK